MHVGWLEFAFACVFSQLGHFHRDFRNRLGVSGFDDRYDEAIWGVSGKTDVEIFFVDEVVAIQRGIEFREFFQRLHAGFDQKGEHGEFDTRFFVLFVELNAEGFEFGYVGDFVIGHVWNHDPVARQVLSRNFLDA